MSHATNNSALTKPARTLQAQEVAKFKRREGAPTLTRPAEATAALRRGHRPVRVADFDPAAVGAYNPVQRARAAMKPAATVEMPTRKAPTRKVAGKAKKAEEPKGLLATAQGVFNRLFG